MKKSGKGALWLFAVLCMLAGAAGLVQGEWVSGLLMLLLGLTLCPQAWKVLGRRKPVRGVYKIITPTLLFILTGLTIPTDSSIPTNFALPAGSAGQAVASSTENRQPDLLQPRTYGSLAVHFIDVGQGDSILAESDGHYMLIDAGENDQGDTVVTYLQSQGIDTLDYVIGTHPHSDHIGGLDDVINNFKSGRVILPDAEHTTKTFEDVLDAIQSQGKKITLPVVGDTYRLGGASFEIIAPNQDYGDDRNNWSVGIKLTYGQNSFVMCGDAEAKAEADICGNGIDISADVLKLGHHGSSTSSSEAFLDQVNPSCAVISCGMGNSYGHPHRETMEQMEARGIAVFRTDEQGTVVAVSDGTDITWNVKPSMPEKKEAGSGLGQEENLTDQGMASGQENAQGQENLQGQENAQARNQETASAQNQETAPVQNQETAPASNRETEAVKPQETDPSQSSKEAEKSGPSYVLNTKSKKFHLPSCNSLPTSNREDTDMSREEIISRDYTPCKRCNP